MAVVRVPKQGRTVDEPSAVVAFLAAAGIEHERWTPAHPLGASATSDEVLAAYAKEIGALKARGGYVTADVIDVRPETPNLETLLAKFRSEHWHDEDEVRFILEGRGIFFVHPREADVFAIEVGPGDLIRVPRGTWHWFDLCDERRIRAIRLFQDPAGWTPRYTESGAEKRYEPVCLGPTHVAARA